MRDNLITICAVYPISSNQLEMNQDEEDVQPSILSSNHSQMIEEVPPIQEVSEDLTGNPGFPGAQDPHPDINEERFSLVELLDPVVPGPHPGPVQQD